MADAGGPIGGRPRARPGVARPTARPPRPSGWPRSGSIFPARSRRPRSRPRTPATTRGPGAAASSGGATGLHLTTKAAPPPVPAGRSRGAAAAAAAPHARRLSPHRRVLQDRQPAHAPQRVGHGRREDTASAATPATAGAPLHSAPAAPGRPTSSSGHVRPPDVPQPGWPAPGTLQRLSTVTLLDLIVEAGAELRRRQAE
jgi:hypothetical protein